MTKLSQQKPKTPSKSNQSAGRPLKKTTTTTPIFNQARTVITNQLIANSKSNNQPTILSNANSSASSVGSSSSVSNARNTRNTVRRGNNKTGIIASIPAATSQQVRRVHLQFKERKGYNNSIEMSLSPNTKHHEFFEIESISNYATIILTNRRNQIVFHANLSYNSAFGLNKFQKVLGIEAGKQEYERHRKRDVGFLFDGADTLAVCISNQLLTTFYTIDITNADGKLKTGHESLATTRISGDERIRNLDLFNKLKSA